LTDETPTNLTNIKTEGKLEEKDVLFLIKETYSQRRKLFMPLSSVFYSLSALCVPCRRFCRSMRRESRVKDKLLERGIERVEDSLDITRIIRQSDLLRNIIHLNFEKP
jgi:hypothetical protein